MHPPDFRTAPLPEDIRSERVHVNLSGDYRYLTDGYYRSMQAEHEGMVAIPGPQEAIDAYVVPLALAKAAAAGIDVPRWEIANDEPDSFPLPMLLYPVNPFQTEGQVISDPAALEEATKSLTLTGKYAMVCQEMRRDSRVDTLRLVLGRSLKPEYRELAQRLWEVFHLPLARVKVIVTEDQYLFSAIEPLKREELTQNEKGILKEAGLWRD
jgi:hypothetical protein